MKKKMVRNQTRSPPVTISFNTAGSIFGNVGKLCTKAIEGLAYPVNCNLYITPQVRPEEGGACGKIVPLHTDRQDVLVFQTNGTKRWRIYPRPSPPKKGVDPFNRGKAGDIVEQSEVDESRCLDCTLEEGDVLYVPIGWAHETATPHKDATKGSSLPPVSVHITLGIDSVVWGLTYAHLRWGVLSYYGLDYNVDLQKVKEEFYWKSMDALPFGFLQGSDDSDKEVTENLIELLAGMEPERKDLPLDADKVKVAVEIFKKHAQSIIAVQRDMYESPDPKSPEAMFKAMKGTRELSVVMARLGASVFCDPFRAAHTQKVKDMDAKLSAASAASQ